MQDAIKEAVDTQNAKKLNWDALNPQINYEGRHIVLPGDPGRMPPEKAVEALDAFIEWWKPNEHIYEGSADQPKPSPDHPVEEPKP